MTLLAKATHFLADSLSLALDDPQIGVMSIHFGSRRIGCMVLARESIALGLVVTAVAAGAVGDSGPCFRK